VGKERFEDGLAQGVLGCLEALHILDHVLVPLEILKIWLHPYPAAIVVLDLHPVDLEPELRLHHQMGDVTRPLEHMQIVAALGLLDAVMGVTMQALGFLRPVLTH